MSPTPQIGNLAYMVGRITTWVAGRFPMLADPNYISMGTHNQYHFVSFHLSTRAEVVAWASRLGGQVVDDRYETGSGWRIGASFTFTFPHEVTMYEPVTVRIYHNEADTNQNPPEVIADEARVAGEIRKHLSDAGE